MPLRHGGAGALGQPRGTDEPDAAAHERRDHGMKNMDRRTFLAGSGSLALALGLAACSDDAASAPSDDSSDDASSMAAIDKDAYSALVSSAPTADDSAIEASEWAKKVKGNGTLRVGGVKTSTLFALMDETDNTVRGFDAGLYQMLARYILGDETKVELTGVTSDTRESVLQNDQVDAVFATYTITDKRKEVISFAGPYYTSQYSVLVLADNSDITGVDSLAGKNVAAQSGSTGPDIVAEFAPEAVVQEFSTDEEARTALEQGRVDAYVYDDSMNKSSIVKNPGKYKVAGDPFGPTDPYGIALPKDSDGVAFVNDYLKAVEDAGLWEKLWHITIGDRTNADTAPEPPAFDEA